MRAPGMGSASIGAVATTLMRHAHPPARLTCYGRTATLAVAASYRMPKIPLSRAEPGQCIAKPIISASGVKMVQAGAELTPGLIERLKSFGVDSIVVSGGSADVKPLDVLLQELDARFAGHELDPWMTGLKQIVEGQLRQAASRTDNA